MRDAVDYKVTLSKSKYQMTEMCYMKEMDDLDIKAEIDEITKKIDAIIKNIEHLEPNRQDSDDNQN